MSIRSVAGFTKIRGVGTACMQNLYNKTRMIANFHLLVGTNAVWMAPYLYEMYVIEP
jgi:hypothetical protein